LLLLSADAAVARLFLGNRYYLFHHIKSSRFGLDFLPDFYMNVSPQVDAQSHGQDKLLAETVVLTRLDKAIGWARKYSLFPYPFATACCAMEYMSLSMSPYDIDRFGALLPRFSPRQADLLMVIGTVNHKLSPVLKRVYEQMSEPKWVMAFGACAASGGFYDNYATVQGIDRIIPVDVYVPGCPPRPEAVLDGLMQLQSRIASQKQPL
jgi:NADH-quinone oxidoreductase subunit B